jgi:acyl carrier protein
MKQTLIGEATILEILTNRVAATLRLDKQTITPDSSLIKDLGAESLDFLDINYGLEQTFGIKMPRHLVLEHVEELFGEGSAIDQDSQLTERGAALLKLRFGQEADDLKAGVSIDDIMTRVTLRTVVKGLQEILDTLPDRCPKCGHSGWACADGVRIRCGQCEEPATFTSGDSVIKNWLQRVEQEHRLFS